MPDYSRFGNEKLLPLAIGGNVQAEGELNDRGNTLTVDGKLMKVHKTTKRNYDGDRLISTDLIERTVVNGQLVKVTVNGVETSKVADV